MSNKQVKNTSPTRERASAPGVRASVTIEAAFAVPLFMFAVLSLIFLIEIQSIRGCIHAAGSDAAKQAAESTAVLPVLNTIQLKSIIETKRGAEYGKNFIKTFNSGIKILLGYDMQAYTIKWNNSFVDTNLKDISRLLDFFKTKNLIYLRRVDKRLSASISNETFAFTKNIYGIKITDVKYNYKLILALLNSNLLNFYYLNKFTTKKEDVFPEIQTYLYEQLPIPEINSKNKEIADKIINNVDEILKIKNKNSNSDISIIEREIDILVYELYNLEDKEIEAIEK